jgi:hypothetical protein
MDPAGSFVPTSVVHAISFDLSVRRYFPMEYEIRKDFECLKPSVPILFGRVLRAARFRLFDLLSPELFQLLDHASLHTLHQSLTWSPPFAGKVHHNKSYLSAFAWEWR